MWAIQDINTHKKLSSPISNLDQLQGFWKNFRGRPWTHHTTWNVVRLGSMARSLMLNCWSCWGQQNCIVRLGISNLDHFYRYGMLIVCLMKQLKILLIFLLEFLDEFDPKLKRHKYSIFSFKWHFFFKFDRRYAINNSHENQWCEVTHISTQFNPT